MRIVQIVASLEARHGGPSISVPKLANAMAEFEPTIELLATGPERATRRVAAPCPQQIFPRGWPESLCPCRGLARYVANVEADILHSHGLWLRPLHYVHRRSRQRGIPHVISPRGMMAPWAWENRRWKKQLAEALIHPGALRAARGWHATSAEEAEDIRRLGFKQPICIAPNGVEAPAEAALAEAREYWQRVCPEAWTRPTALFFSRFHRKKRVLELIDLWLQHAPADWLLLMVGIPQEYSVEQLQAYIIRNSGGGRIIVHDGTNAPPPYVAGCLFLLPSHSENFGLVVAEALAHGLPVLVTDTMPWAAVNQTDYGWCGPWEQYASALKAALALGPDTLRSRGVQAKDWVIREYSWRQSARRVLDFYQSLR